MWVRNRTRPVGRKEVAEVVSRRYRIPVDQIGADETLRLLTMEAALRQRVIGQDEAVQVVADTIRAARAGLQDPLRPLGVFLLAGATGTGKTELAKALAEFLFHDEHRLIRIDMSEYMERHTVSRLIGSPPGYIGHDEEGQLTGPVRTNPYSVVLFDEIEKAHPKVLDVCLQIFDEGHLTDTHGRRVSFKETVIILTTNLGAQPWAEGGPRRVGFRAHLESAHRVEADDPREGIVAAVRNALRPELLNRITRVVVFQPLDRAAVRRILDKVIDRLQATTALRDRRINLVLGEDAYMLLMNQGFSAQYGAREMERTVDRLLTKPLARALLEKRFSPNATLHVSVEEHSLSFTTQQDTQSPKE